MTAGQQQVTLNWGKDCKCKVRHWSMNPKPCRHCGGPTSLRDFDGRPAHKVCAERLATAELVAAQRRVGAAS